MDVQIVKQICLFLGRQSIPNQAVGNSASSTFQGRAQSKVVTGTPGPFECGQSHAIVAAL